MRKLFSKDKNDVVTASMLLKDVATGEIGPAELEEIIVLLCNSIDCHGLTLYGFDYSGELKMVATSYDSDNPGWVNAQKRALQKAVEGEYIYGANYDLIGAVLDAYKKSNVDCAILPLKVGSYCYGYLIADCDKGYGAEVRKDFETWGKRQEHTNYILYMGLCALLRITSMTNRVMRVRDESDMLDSHALRRQMSAMPDYSLFMYITFPDEPVVRDLVKRVRQSKIEDVLKQRFGTNSSVYHVDDGIYAGVFSCEFIDEDNLDFLKVQVMSDLTKEGFKPCIYTCYLVNDFKANALNYVEYHAVRARAGEFYELRYDFNKNAYLPLSEFPTSHEGDLIGDEVDEMEIVDEVDVSIDDDIGEGEGEEGDEEEGEEEYEEDGANDGDDVAGEDYENENGYDNGTEERKDVADMFSDLGASAPVQTDRVFSGGSLGRGGMRNGRSKGVEDE